MWRMYAAVCSLLVRRKLRWYMWHRRRRGWCRNMALIMGICRRSWSLAGMYLDP